jgi:hypothetical protein
MAHSPPRFSRHSEDQVPLAVGAVQLHQFEAAPSRARDSHFPAQLQSPTQTALSRAPMLSFSSPAVFPAARFPLPPAWER